MSGSWSTAPAAKRSRPSCHDTASGEAEREALGVDDPIVDDLDAVPQDLRAGRREELAGRHAIA